MPVPQPPRSTRRELLKMLPLAGTTALLHPDSRSRVLARGPALSDAFSEWTFDARLLAPTFSDAEVTPLDRFHLNSYLVDDPEIDLWNWRLAVSGLVARPGEYTLYDLRELPRIRQNTRHVCIEGWDVIGSFGGMRLSDLLTLVGADQRARFLEIRCADDYYESLDMLTARHPQSLLCDEMYGLPLRREHGAPLRLVLPTKLGYKQAKYIVGLHVTDVLGAKRGYWVDRVQLVRRLVMPRHRRACRRRFCGLVDGSRAPCRGTLHPCGPEANRRCSVSAMRTLTRREQLKAMLAFAGLAPWQGASQTSRPAGQARDAVIPPAGIGRRIRHLSYSDQGGRPDGVQVMVNRRHVYVGHMFSDGVTILDATDPRRLKPVGFFTAGVNTRTHHLQISDDLMLLANGANIVAMQSYDNLRGYFENALVDSISNKKKFRSGLSIHDISRPGEMREIAFLEIPGFGVNRLSWMGGRYAYLSAHFDGFTDHIFCIVDLQEITKPQIVSRWWMPGMHRAGGEKPTSAPGKRVALHHAIVAGDRAYGAWRDGGLTIHNIGDPSSPKLVSHINWSPPFPGGTHTALPLPGRNLVVVADEANAEKCAKGTFHTFVVDVRAPENPVPIATLPTPTDRDFCVSGTFGPHNLHENRPGSFRSEELIVATYNNAGVRIFDIKDAFAPKEIASWVPPTPKKLIDPRPNVALAAKTADIFVMTDGLMYVSDWNAGLNVLQYEG